MKYEIAHENLEVIGEDDEYIQFYCPACEVEDIEVEIGSEYFDTASDILICPQCGAVITLVIE